jgi:DNA-binding MarR family transcriptional regulator
MQLAHESGGPGVVPDEPALELIDGISTLIRAVRCAEHRHVWPAVGLRRADASVLRVLARGGELRSGEIATKLSVDASVVSRQLAALEAEGLVVRRPDPADARVSLAALSDSGRERLDALHKSYTNQLRAALSDLSDEDLGNAAQLLHRIAQAVVEPFPDGAA